MRRMKLRHAAALVCLSTAGAAFLMHHYMHLRPMALIQVVSGGTGALLYVLLMRFRLWRLNRYGEEIERRMGQTPK